MMSTELNRKLIKEFEDIVKDAEQRIRLDRNYIQSKEFLEQKKRMTEIMRRVEGCGCAGRGQHLAAMFRGLQQGRLGTLRAFGPLVFKSFWIDAQKFVGK